MLITRARVGLAGLAVVAAGLPLGSSLASGQTAAPAQAPGGTIHLFLTNTSTSPSADDKVLITGLFTDHGYSGPVLSIGNVEWHLAKGTVITSYSKNLRRTFFGTVYLPSCSYSGSTRGSVRIVTGTGAYRGIKGTLKATLTQAAEGNWLPNGTCDATGVYFPDPAQDFIGIGNGKVQF